MPITLTVTGHNEIIASLQNLSDKLDGPEVVQALGQMSSSILTQETPVGRRGDAGKLQRTMSEMAGPEPTGQGWWMGVGNLEGIYPLEPAPKGTIAAFLKRWREQHGGTAKKRVSNRGEMKSRVVGTRFRRRVRLGGFRPRRTMRRRVGTGFNPKHAWWYLTDEQKRELRAMREAGIEDVGGASPYRPFYWWIQEEGHGEVGIKGQHYIARAIQQIRGRIGSTILEVLQLDRGGPIPTDYGAFYR